MIQDIEDNYPDYVDDERGYTWDAWDVLSADVIRRHDGILRSSPEALTKLDPAGLDDLDRWAYARASRRMGDIDGFLDAGRLVLASEHHHRGVDYRGVFTAVIETLSREGASDEARLLLEDMRKRWPEDPEADRLGVWIALHFDEVEARSVIDAAIELHGDDPEFVFELAEDAHAAGRDEMARELLERSRTIAQREEQTAILVDIRLFAEKLGLTEE